MRTTPKAVAWRAAAVALCAAVAHPAWTQGWNPQRVVELIVPASAGGSLDATGRTVHRIFLGLAK